MPKGKGRRGSDAPAWHRYQLRNGRGVRLSAFDPGDTSAFSGGKRAGRKAQARLTGELEGLQTKLFAEHRRGVLIVLQGMDTAGKDGTIRRVFEGVDPQGVRVVQFRRPVGLEEDHDFLWRVHRQVPARGEMVLFNRSHYEDVLAVPVHGLAPPSVWRPRYREIIEFERMLTCEGTTVLKFFLYLSRAEQAERLRERETDPAKRWKSSPADEAEAGHFQEYLHAYEEVLRRTSTRHAPWYVIPSDHRWYRDWLVSRILVARLNEMHLKIPKDPVEPPAGSTGA
jgi:PPK2 family polyphosphate:nucleotide phosphotransferase